jgi:protein SCO1/2
MSDLRLCLLLVLACLAASCAKQSSHKTFHTRGIITEVRTNSLIIHHEAIPGYMDAMTMPFNVKDRAIISSLNRGDKISFTLFVTDNQSWIENIVRLSSGHTGQASAPAQPATQNTNSVHPLRAYKWTNELGQPISLDDLKGNALAITFFFTRCPIPEYCPRLSKNFQQAQTQLLSLPNAPTNWRLLSVTIDPDADTPPVLKAYAQRYQYNPRHWSFLTGPKDKLTEFANLSDLTFNWEGNFLNHNFRTLIIDPTGKLQMVFPIGGDISAAIVDELLKAATNSPAPPN